MVDENKVKLMTRMALYEQKHGAEDMKINAYYKKDYASFHAIVTVIWVTIGYAIAVVIGAVAFLDELLAHLNMPFLIMLGICVVAGYFVVAALYALVASRFYGEKHNQARQRVKRFSYDLTRLNRMYERKRRRP